MYIRNQISEAELQVVRGEHGSSFVVCQVLKEGYKALINVLHKLNWSNCSEMYTL